MDRETETQDPRNTEAVKHLFFDLNRGLTRLRLSETGAEPVDTRVVLLDRNLMIALEEAFDEGSESVLADVLFESGYSWGQSYFEQISRKLSHRFPENRNVQSVSKEVFLKELSHDLIRMGVGRFDIREGNRAFFITLENSAFDQLSFRSVDRNCFLPSGFFAGLFSNVSQKQLSCVEISCSASDDEICAFALSTAKITGEIKTWLSEGLSKRQIVENLEQL